MVTVLKKAVRFDLATAAIKGGRDYQEDSLIASFPHGQETGFAVLSDGMGGHMSGDVASAIVMSEVFSQIKRKEMLLDKDVTDISALLHGAATAANTGIARYIAEDPDSNGMGATLLACVVRGDDLYWVSVGDSPLFLFRDGELRQLNQDHSMAPQIDMMVKVGAMDAEYARNHPDRNTLTSAIAGAEIDRIDCPIEPTAILPGDILVASSDGLQFLAEDEIADVLRKTQYKPSADISEALLAAIDELGDPDQDNTAFSVIKLGERAHAFAAKPKDKASALVQLRADLGHADTTPVDDKAKPAVAATGSAPIDLPAKRIIRLVQSESLTFDEPVATVRAQAN